MTFAKNNVSTMIYHNLMHFGQLGSLKRCPAAHRSLGFSKTPSRIVGLQMQSNTLELWKRSADMCIYIYTITYIYIYVYIYIYMYYCSYKDQEWKFLNGPSGNGKTMASCPAANPLRAVGAQGRAWRGVYQPVVGSPLWTFRRRHCTSLPRYLAGLARSRH